MRFDTRSTERGWGPFMDWMSSEGLDAGKVKTIYIDEGTMRAEVTVIKVGPFNRPHLGWGGEVATRTRTVQLKSLPPCRDDVETGEVR